MHYKNYQEALMNNKQIIQNFWDMMATNDFYAVARLLHNDYVLEWPQSGERIRGRENFASINTFYPAEGAWRFTINSLIDDGDMVASDVSVTDGKRNDRV